MLLHAEPQMGVFSSFPEEKHGNFLGSVLRATGDYLQHKSAHRGVLLVYSLFDHLLCQNHILQTNVPDSWMFCLEKQWYSALLKKKKWLSRTSVIPVLARARIQAEQLGLRKDDCEVLPSCGTLCVRFQLRRELGRQLELRSGDLSRDRHKSMGRNPRGEIHVCNLN